MKKTLLILSVILVFCGCKNQTEPANDSNDELNNDELSNDTDISDDVTEYSCLHHCWMSPYKSPYKIEDRYKETGNGVEIVVTDSFTGLKWAAFGSTGNFKRSCSELIFNGESGWREADKYEIESVKLHNYGSKVYVDNVLMNINSFKIPNYVGTCVKGKEETNGNEPGRFLEKTTEGEKVVSDRKTGLIWTGESFEDSSFSCEDLVYGGYDSWEQPDVYQLKTLISWYSEGDFLTYFPQIEKGYYRSSTQLSISDGPSYYLIDFKTGTVKSELRGDFIICVLKERFPVSENNIQLEEPASKAFSTLSESEECADKECGWDPSLCGTCDYENGFFCRDFQCQEAQRNLYTDRNAVEDRFSETGDAEKIIHDKCSELQWTLTSWDFSTETGSWRDCNIDYGGYSDWRLPEISELETLFSYWKPNPPYSNFSGMDSRTYLSSSSFMGKYGDSYCSDSNFAADFGKRQIYCADYHFEKDLRIKCVRGNSKTMTSSRYHQKIINDQVIVYDVGTGLRWTKKTVEGLELADAVKYCEDLEYGDQNDWHLPDVYEIITLLKWNLHDPASFFPMINSQNYWIYNKDADLGFKVDFEYGWVGEVHPSSISEIHTICVK